MRIRASRVRFAGPVPNGALVVRPVGMGLLEVIALSGLRRWWRLASALVVVAVATALARPDSRTAGVWVLSVCVIGAMSVVMARQPRTYVYTYQDRVGLHTTFGSRYELPSESVRTVRTTAIPMFGVLTRGLSLEGSDGRPLLVHANATYDEGELQALAIRIGAQFVES